MGYIYHADGTITKVQITDNLMLSDARNKQGFSRSFYVGSTSPAKIKKAGVYTSGPTGGSNAGTGKQILVNFIQQPDMPFYGFDSHNPALTAYQNCYQQIKVNRGNYFVPWVSVPAYTSDVVAASVNLNNSNIGYGQVNFKSATGPIVAMPTSTDSIFNLAVQGAEHGSTTTYEAFYTDSVAGGRTADIVAGQVNVVAYNPLAINVCIVGVNSTVYPYDIGNLKAGLNRVLQQAVTTAQVSTLTLTNVDWDIDNNKNLSDSETGLLSSYNAEMKRLRRAVKQNPNYNPDTYYLFILPASNDATLAGYMPLTGHFGFIFTQPNNTEQKIIRTISHAIRDFCFWQQKQISRVSPDKTITVNAKQINAHREQQKQSNAQAKGFIGELGHGAFNLWHTFSSNNQYIAAQGTTNNLMDYTPNPTDSKLQKYQWDLIHNPESMVGWLQDEEEGEMGSSPGSYVSYFIEKIRCLRKEGNNSFSDNSFQYVYGENKRDVLSTPDLLDNVNYGSIWGWYLCNSSNAAENVDVSKIEQIGSKVFVGNRQGCFLTFLVKDGNGNESDGLAVQLKDYLAADISGFGTQLQSLLTKMDGMDDISIQIKKLPDCGYSEISNSRRIDYLNKLSSKANENIHYILKLLNTVRKENITSFFTKLGETLLFYNFNDRSNISFDNYTAFIRAATLLYYQQDGLKDTLINIPYNRIFINQDREGTFGASISNYFTPIQNKLLITGNVALIEQTLNAYGYPIASGTKAFQAYSYPVGYCDLIGLELVSDFGHLKASVHDDIVPLPAFYFDWINTNRQNEANCKMIDATITIASLAIGVSELRLAIKSAQYAYAAYLGVGTALTTYNLVRLNADIDTYFDQAAMVNDDVRDFFDALDTWSYLFDLSNVVVSRIVTKDNKQFFNDFVAAWTISKDGVFDHILNHPEGGNQKAQEVTAEFQKLVDEIIIEINKQ